MSVAEYKKKREDAYDIQLKGENDLKTAFSVDIKKKAEIISGIAVYTKTPICDGKYFAKYFNQRVRLDEYYLNFCQAIGNFFEKYINLNINSNSIGGFEKVCLAIYYSDEKKKKQAPKAECLEVLGSFHEFSAILFSDFKTEIRQCPRHKNPESIAFIPDLLDSFDNFVSSVSNSNIKSWMHISKLTRDLLLSLKFMSVRYNKYEFKSLISPFIDVMKDIDLFLENTLGDYKKILQKKNSNDERNELLGRANIDLQIFADRLECGYNEFLTTCLHAKSDGTDLFKNLCFFHTCNNYSAIVYIFRTLASLYCKRDNENIFYVYDDFLENLTLAFTHLFVSYLDFQVPIPNIIPDLKDDKNNKFPKFQSGLWNCRSIQDNEKFAAFLKNKRAYEIPDSLILTQILSESMKRKIKNCLTLQINRLLPLNVDILKQAKGYNEIYLHILGLKEHISDVDMQAVFEKFVFQGLRKEKPQTIDIHEVIKEYFGEFKQKYEAAKDELVPIFHAAYLNRCSTKFKKRVGLRRVFDLKGLLNSLKERETLKKQENSLKETSKQQENSLQKDKSTETPFDHNLKLTLVSLLMLDLLLAIVLLVRRKVSFEEYPTFTNATIKNRKARKV